MSLENIVESPITKRQTNQHVSPQGFTLERGESFLNSMRQSIKVKLPTYQRFSKFHATSLRGFTQYDSTAEKEDTQIEISSTFAWILLLLNVVSSALVPCWLMSNLAKQPHTRNSWRFFVLSILTLPLVAYERRRLAQMGIDIRQVITVKLLKQNFLQAVHFCIEFLFCLETIRLTSMTHSTTLVSLKFFVLAIFKIYRGKLSHEFQKAGIILVSVGIFLTLSDSCMNYHYDEITNQNFVRNRLLRISGDIIALSGSVIVALLYQKYTLTIPEEPRFLNLFFQNIFISFNFICFGYYFGGSQLSFNQFYGVFGLLNPSNFVTIFYVGIMLGFNLMISNTILYEVYSPFILDIANSFGPLITALFYQLLMLDEVMAYTYLSFGFFVPGLILILSGDNASKNGEVKMDFVVYHPAREMEENRMPSIVEMEEWERLGLMATQPIGQEQEISSDSF